MKKRSERVKYLVLHYSIDAIIGGESKCVAIPQISIPILMIIMERCTSMNMSTMQSITSIPIIAAMDIRIQIFHDR